MNEEDRKLAFFKLPIMLEPEDGLTDGINQAQLIHEGDIELQMQAMTLAIKGNLTYKWRPSPGIRLSGEVDRYVLDFDIQQIRIPNLDLEHGQAFLTRMGGSEGNIEGIVNFPFVIRHLPLASRLTFYLPNFRQILGINVRNKDWSYANRIVLENDQWLINLDRFEQADNIRKLLKEDGGYGLTYMGEAICKQGKFDHRTSTRLISDLGLFLSFANARRCFPCLIKGWDGELLSWKDFSSYHAGEYKEDPSWLPQTYQPELSDLWTKFSAIAQDPDDRECLEFLIHWYLEANDNSGFAEGSIVFMQNAFELMYNWQVVEKDKTVTVAQAKSMQAAAKLRALLLRAGMPINVPASYQRIVNDLHQKGVVVADLPELFTRVRNAIVHSDDKKRKTLQAVPSMDRFHIRQLGLHCLELLILHVLGYSGKYANRVSDNRFTGGNEEQVPWPL